MGIEAKDSRPKTDLERAMGADFSASDATERLEALIKMNSLSIGILGGTVVSTLHQRDLPYPLQQLSGRRVFVPTGLIKSLQNNSV